MNRTDIEWTDWSANPIKLELPDGSRVNACVKCSPGCANCYAESGTRRWWKKDRGKFPGYSLPLIKQGKIVLVEKELQAVLRLDARIAAGRADPAVNKIFWGDMTDLFGDWVPFEMLDRLFAVFALTPRLIHQVLTKRPERMAEYLDKWATRHKWGAAARKFVDKPNNLPGAGDQGCHPDVCNCVYPLPNVWLGTSVDSQEWADKRIPHLLKCPATVRFLSCEPLLGPVNLDLACGWRIAIGCCSDNPPTFGSLGIHWIIVGGESGPAARPMHPNWARGLRDQCQAAGVPFFFKQWGEWAPLQHHPEEGGSLERVQFWDNDFGKWATGIRTFAQHMVRVGKGKAGRLLDGREWNEMPNAAAPVAAAAAEVTS